METGDCPWEEEVQSLGTEIFTRIGQETPSLFRKDYWSGRMIDWCMKNPAFKVQMFRLVDVLPSLGSYRQVAQHLKEYLSQPGVDLPTVLQWMVGSLASNPITALIAAQQTRKNVEEIARRFIVGRTPQEALEILRKGWDRGMSFTLDLLGEAAVSELEAKEYQSRYMEIFQVMGPEMEKWPLRDPIRDSEFPRLSISLKLSSLYSQIDPVNFEGSISTLKERLRPIFRAAREQGAFVNIDMEHYALCDLTLATFRSLLEEEEFREQPRAGIVIQTYLRDHKNYLQDLVKWAEDRDRPITIRLVKGAYWDYEQVVARSNNWDVPVYLHKAQTDRAFEEATHFCLSRYPLVHTALATHNVRSIAHGVVTARRLGVPEQALEIQMLYGMAEPIKDALLHMGFRLCEYSPIGDLLPGMAYLVRRLLENTSNESFLKRIFADGVSPQDLLAPFSIPKEPLPEEESRVHWPGPFRQEPPRDFARASHRSGFAKALESVEWTLGKTHPIWIDGREVRTSRELISVNPARPSQVVGRSYLATLEEAQRALEAAQRACPRWRETSVENRATLLLKVAEILRSHRDHLASLQVYEVSKTWREADADVCEAIDFCEYYARQMLKLAKPSRLDPIPGEINELLHEPRGVALVIAPWNFPLAISTGMTMAALVAGNPVIYKPSSLSPVTGAALAMALRKAGVPRGVFQYFPCSGGETASWLVEDPRVALVAFTGSKEVGLEILLRASAVREGQDSVKRVIAEMGGKNAIIVDADADLDAAVVGVVQSAFGFQGQKCSACSRVVVLKDIYRRFVHRLVEATKSLKVGDPANPAVQVGAVIDAEAQRRIRQYVEIGKEEGELLFQADVPSEGFFVGPTIFGNIQPHHRLAQEEIFGPVLSLMPVENMEHALQVANSTPYALTGGLYSRSPANIELVKRHFRVGNLYINRKITGAIVGRQPFGGLKLSGVGFKAGGPDYLLQFLETRTLTENTLRRGFAPELET
ncbi:MAG: L-glutamate gamma-semialdehyde dehydrogenase [Thermodesulfobacteriota bacterium]